MPLTGTTNTSANTALRYLAINNANASSSLAKLSSGSRIVKASDDAASLAVGTKIKADVSALKQAAVNAGQASSLLQVADGGLSRVADILQRMKALAVQSQSGSVTNSERSFLDQEFQALATEINDIAGQTKFNSSVLLNGASGKSVSGVAAALTTAGMSVELSGNAANGAYTVDFDGTNKFDLTKPDGNVETIYVTPPTGSAVFEGTVEFKNAGISFNVSNLDVVSATAVTGTFNVAGTGTLDFQVGVAAADKISVSINDVRTTALGINGNNVLTTTGATTASNNLDTAISKVNSARAGLGAYMSRFEFASANLATSIENLDAARSTLMDVDMATEMSKFTSAQVLSQAGVSMLAQANQMPQQLLRLLQ